MIASSDMASAAAATKALEAPLVLHVVHVMPFAFGGFAVAPDEQPRVMPEMEHVDTVGCVITVTLRMECE